MLRPVEKPTDSLLTAFHSHPSIFSNFEAVSHLYAGLPCVLVPQDRPIWTHGCQDPIGKSRNPRWQNSMAVDSIQKLCPIMFIVCCTIRWRISGSQAVLERRKWACWGWILFFQTLFFLRILNNMGVYTTACTLKTQGIFKLFNYSWPWLHTSTQVRTDSKVSKPTEKKLQRQIIYNTGFFRGNPWMHAFAWGNTTCNFQACSRHHPDHLWKMRCHGAG